jgi:hypothetical protein
LELGGLLVHLPLAALGGWVVRVPLISPEEGHEAITREAWEGLPLTLGQQRALIRGVRAPDVSLTGLLTSVLPFAQRRHALRAWNGSTTADGVRDLRDFVTSRHRRAVALPESDRRWAAFGEVLHAIQDSYSTAHTERDGTRIVLMRHWGPLDARSRRRHPTIPSDEHGFPDDPRDKAWQDGALTGPARLAVTVSRRYLELVSHAEPPDAVPAGVTDPFRAFLDAHVRA